MALSTTDVISIYEGAPDSAIHALRAPVMKVDILATETPLYRAALTCSDSSGNTVGAQVFDLTSTELIAQEATFAAAFATVQAAYQKALKARLLAMTANSGVTITYS